MERFRVTWAISSQLCCFGWFAYWIVFSPFLRLMMHELSCPPISRLFLFFFSFRFHLCAPCLVGSACCKKFFYEASVLTNRSFRTCFWGLFHYAFCRLTTVQHAKLLVIIFSLFIVPKAPFLHFVSNFDACSSIRSQVLGPILLCLSFYQVYFYPLFSPLLSLTCSLLSLDRWHVKREAACAKFYLPSFLPWGCWNIRSVGFPSPVPLKFV